MRGLRILAVSAFASLACVTACASTPQSGIHIFEQPEGGSGSGGADGSGGGGASGSGTGTGGTLGSGSGGADGAGAGGVAGSGGVAGRGGAAGSSGGGTAGVGGSSGSGSGGSYGYGSGGATGTGGSKGGGSGGTKGSFGSGGTKGSSGGAGGTRGTTGSGGTKGSGGSKGSGSDAGGDGYAFFERPGALERHALALSADRPETIAFSWREVHGQGSPADLWLEADGRPVLQVFSIGGQPFVRVGLEVAPLDADGTYRLQLEGDGASVGMSLVNAAGVTTLRARTPLGDPQLVAQSSLPRLYLVTPGTSPRVFVSEIF